MNDLFHAAGVFFFFMCGVATLMIAYYAVIDKIDGIVTKMAHKKFQRMPLSTIDFGDLLGLQHSVNVEIERRNEIIGQEY